MRIGTGFQHPYFALNKNERVEEVARMLSGEQMSKAAMENAKELLKSS